MNSKKLLDLRFAKKYCPALICGLSKGKDYLIDFPTEIYLHDFDPEKNGKPAIYYNGWEYGKDVYLMYALYHRMDKNHEHDFEGFVVKRNKTNNLEGENISVSHFGYKYYPFPEPYVTIEPRTHGIHPCSEKMDWNTIMRSDILKFIPMFRSAWNRTVKEATPKFEKHGVRWPWEWNSFDGKYLIRQWAKRYLKDELNGLIYYRPDLLFELIENWDHKSMMIPKLKEYLRLKEYLKEIK